MKPIHLAFGAIALGLALSASAVTSSSYGFNTKTGGTSAWNATSAGANPTSGTNYGNSLTYTSTGIAIPVAVTAWATTGNGGGYGGTFETAFLNNAYSTNGKTELAITSRSAVNAAGTSTGANAELVNWAPNSNANEHAIDNSGAYEDLLFSFQSAVTLTDVSVGFPSSTSSVDSDATILVYTGSGDPGAGTAGAGNLSTRTLAQLLANGWKVAANPLDIAKQPGGHEAVSTTYASKYWLVGAYESLNTGSTNLTDGKDYIKVNGLTAVRAVPEPSSLALLGIAGGALFANRRRRQRKA